jgi:glycosyltransferase involved in cell wall biosynthesis
MPTLRLLDDAMPSPLFLDVSHTSHTRARTGVQRVARSLRRELAGLCVPVTHDPYEETWRPLEAWEELNLAEGNPAAGRGAQWPLLARLRGRLRRGRPDPLAAAAAFGGSRGGLIAPEIFSAAAGAALPELFAASAGPRVALFHDAVALQYPEFTPRSTVARFPAYLRELLAFDGVAAVSESSRTALLDYWRWLGVARAPEVVALPLGIDPAPPAAAPMAPGPVPIVLCVATIEGRKNHAALLDACELLWASGTRFELHLIGIANRETGAPALLRIERLKAAGRPLRYDGAASDAGLEAAYAACAFTVYPSLAEGFGLPVAESLGRGKPCLCRFEGALGEIAARGGCARLGSAGAPEIAAAMAAVLASPADLAALTAAARQRTFKAWPQYAAELLAWMRSLRPNA